MSDWATKKLGDLLTLEYGQALGAEARSGKGFPVYGSNGVVGFHSKSLVTGPGIVVGRKGSAGKVTWTDRDFWPIDTTYWVSSSESSDLRFLREVLNQAGLQRLNSATGVPGLNRQDAYPIQVRVPPLEEQRRIAEILDTIDETIQATERAIAKLLVEKEGLTNDAVSAALRDGDLVLVGEVIDSSSGGLVQTGPFGSQLHQSDYVDKGTATFMPTDIRGEEILVDSASKIPESKVQELRRHVLREGDVLVPRRGDLSKCAVVRNDSIGGLCGTGCLMIRVTTIPPDWMATVYRHDVVQRQVAARAVGSTMMNLSGGLVRSLTIPLPSASSEMAMKSLGLVKDRLANESGRLIKLKTLRSGLAADLLSGRVRTVAS